MNRNKYTLYTKAIDLYGIDDILEGFRDYLIELNYEILKKLENKSGDDEEKWIEDLADVNIMIEIIVLYLKKTNKDQILLTAMHSKMDRLKGMIEKEEREREDNG